MFYVAVSNVVANVGLWGRLAFKCMKVAGTPMVIRWQPAAAVSLHPMVLWKALDPIGSHWNLLNPHGSHLPGFPSYVA